ncbi:YtxH domain-containing protein [Chamaesiphon sp. VAR_69_metabat_338]|uniref:YtxH domain-containing protein n=1 Tax=Chamaesiphon sp. VAR_69_metabat_338 TaxID=2964704 RepID=UPI00286DC28C|nr:YtxH domain-containing protein [Chamaesiphon sp. VAR_69_metabat_338]
MADKHRSTFIGGIAIGAAIGTVTALLMAPRTGRDTRKILGKTLTAVPQMAEDISSSVQLQADKLSVAAGERWQETLDRLATAIAAGITASQSLAELEASTRERSPHEIDK